MQSVPTFYLNLESKFGEVLEHQHYIAGNIDKINWMGDLSRFFKRIFDLHKANTFYII